MVLQLYGSPGSTCTRRVATILKEKEIPFELTAVDFMAGEHKSASFKEKQPFGQVPYIDDDGFILFESRAIARYIAAKYPSQGTSLIPTDLKALAKFEQAASIEQANFDVFASAIASQRVFNKYRGLPSDETRVAQDLKTLEGKLDAYDVILGKQKYLAGNEITLADLFHLPYGSMLKQAAKDDEDPIGKLLESESRPNLARWWKDITSRQSWLAVKDGVSSDLRQ